MFCSFFLVKFRPIKYQSTTNTGTNKKNGYLFVMSTDLGYAESFPISRHCVNENRTFRPNFIYISHRFSSAVQSKFAG